jgi:hypothetical protein
VSGIGETTMPQLVVTVLLCESTTWAMKLYVPAVVGVPVIAPVEALSVRPGGSEPLGSRTYRERLRPWPLVPSCRQLQLAP